MDFRQLVLLVLTVALFAGLIYPMVRGKISHHARPIHAPRGGVRRKTARDAHDNGPQRELQAEAG